MSMSCALCDGACLDATLQPLLNPQLAWLWQQIGAAADRRGDAALVDGLLEVRIPAAAEARAAATGLVGGGILKPEQRRRINLAHLTLKLRTQGARLTPGAVAAHALGRRLAVRAAAQHQRRTREQRLLDTFLQAAATVPHPSFAEPDSIWAALRSSGWITRLVGSADAERLLQCAISIVAALPSGDRRLDRRRLAAEATGDPHALDVGSVLAGLVMAVLVTTGRISPRQHPREAWASVGIACDDVVGGLIAVGMFPVNWQLPPATIVTLPPRVLKGCEWPHASGEGAWVFVTENPSVAGAAADLAAEGVSIRLLCTSGTPSVDEIAALRQLALRGWRLAVRADFDAAGVGHVAAILKMVPHAVPWRMGAQDYLESAPGTLTPGVPLERIVDTPWAPTLAATMRDNGVAAYEESLLPRLLDDLQRGTPP